MHPAFNAPSQLNNGETPVSASPIPSRILKEIPREVTPEEIRDIIKRYAEAAARAQRSECDGVQVHCAHMHHLLGGFVSPCHNKRSDSYGGSLEGRTRLPLEVVRAIRRTVGKDFVILVRISGDEYLPGGISLEQSEHFAPLLVEAGADGLHISGGTSSNPWVSVPPTGSTQAVHAPLAAAIKKVVNVPVICVGRITQPWAAEQILGEGKADLVALGRALLADSEWPNKAASGNWNDIAPCLGDTLCMRSLASKQPIRCLINPGLGREAEKAPAVIGIGSKKVLIVGGGPAGLKAARVAALRGHNVTLMEKSLKLGGQLILAAFPPGKQEYSQAVQYLISRIEGLGIRVELNCEVTRQKILDHQPDVVVLATGGSPCVPPDLPGALRKNVITAWEVLSGKVFPGPHVLVIGGGKVGCETADYLAHPVDDWNPSGNRVTILEMRDHIVFDDLTPWRTILVQRLKKKGVTIITHAQVTEILPDGAKYVSQGQELTIGGMDAIVLALGTVSNNPLQKELDGLGIQIFVIGDANTPRNALEAIAEGCEAGERI
jgi:2,4-dienoyl-CoA reductase-like NADH-dependent reductase (Old Yellow Enzyme family)/thioredoxin reductase